MSEQMEMRRWIVEAVGKEDGQPQHFDLMSSSEDDVLKYVSENGCYASKVVPIIEEEILPLQSPATPPPAAPPPPVAATDFTPPQKEFLLKLAWLHVGGTIAAALLIIIYAMGARAWDRRLIELQAAVTASRETVKRNENGEYSSLRWLAEAIRDGKKEDEKTWIDGMVRDYSAQLNAEADLAEHLGDDSHRDRFPKILDAYRTEKLEDAKSKARR